MEKFMINEHKTNTDSISQELVVWTDNLYRIIKLNELSKQYFKINIENIEKYKIHITNENEVSVSHEEIGNIQLEHINEKINWRTYEQLSEKDKTCSGYIIVGRFFPQNLTEPYFQEVLEKLPGSVYWKDLDGKYMGCNKFVANMAGVASINDVIGKTDFDMPWKSMAYSIREVDQKVIDTLKKIEIEEMPIIKNGKHLIMLTNKEPLFDKIGNLVGIVGTSIDITELKKTRNDLYENMKKLSELYEDKMEFVSMVSHEIRGPIANAKFILELLYNSKIINPVLHEDEKQMVEMNLKEIDHVLESLQYLIKIFNFEKRTPNYTQFDLKEFISNSLRKFNSIPDSFQKPIFTVNIPKSFPLVKSDMFFMTEILEILIKNSMRFSKNNPNIEITVKFDEMNQFFNIIINDKGVGINNKTLEKLSDLIDGNDRDKKDEKKYFNVPIRLTYVNKMLKLIGGNLKIFSEEKTGTDMILSIPHEGKNIKKSSIKEETNNINQKEQKEINKKVLLVEDNDLTRNIEKTILNDAGLIVDSCGNGETAIKMASEKNYRIIFLDISLPDFTGIEVLSTIRKNTTESIIFVAITSHVSEEDIDEFIDSGFATVLSKPLIKSEVSDFLLSIENETD